MNTLRKSVSSRSPEWFELFAIYYVNTYQLLPAFRSDDWSEWPLSDYEYGPVIKHRVGFDIHHALLARGFDCYCLPANPIQAFEYLIDPPRNIPVDHRQAIGNYILNDTITENL